MAQKRFNFPNGSILEIATTFDIATPITAISNAKPPVATSAAHGLIDGDIGLLTSGWSRINNRGVRVANALSGTFALEGLDTTNTSRFPVGKGAGSIVVATGWQLIDKILEVTTNGGDTKFWTGAFLEDDDDTQVPIGRNPQSLALTLGDDPGSLRDAALLDADAARGENQLLRLTLPDGNIVLYGGFVSYNDNPQMSRDNPMTTRMDISMTGRPTRYTEFVS